MTGRREGVTSGCKVADTEWSVQAELNAQQVGLIHDCVKAEGRTAVEVTVPVRCESSTWWIGRASQSFTLYYSKLHKL